MRSIRRAAIAGATAASLLLGAASVATAQENDSQSSSSAVKDAFKQDGKDQSSAKKFSTNVGHALDADRPANGARLFGSTTDVQNEPKWAQLMLAVTYIGVIGSVLGLVVFPAYNFLLANHLLPGQAPR